MPGTVFVPIDVFALANAIWSQRHAGQQAIFSWTLESHDGQTVDALGGTRIAVDGAIGTQAADIVLLPAMHGAAVRSMPYALQTLGPLIAPLRAMHGAGSAIATVGSACFLPAEAGLLDGGHATGQAAMAEAFSARYPQIAFHPVETLTGFNNVFCAGPVAASVNLALYLVGKFAGRELALLCAQALLIDPDSGNHSLLQTWDIPQQFAHVDPLVSMAQKWIDDTLAQPLDLRILADYLAVSQRTLLRRFDRAIGTSPSVYAQQQKIKLAKRLLAASTVSVAQVYTRVGYLDPNSFYRLFKRETGMTPAAYRELQRAPRQERLPQWDA